MVYEGATAHYYGALPVVSTAADKETVPVVPYGRIKPVLIVSIQVGTSAIIG